MYILHDLHTVCNAHRSYSPIDTALHELGLQLLADKMEQQKQDGTWKPLPEVSFPRVGGWVGQRVPARLYATFDAIGIYHYM